MSINTLSIRRPILAGVVSFLALATPFAAMAAEAQQAWVVKPGSVEERPHESSGRQTDLQVARERPSNREVAARVRGERSTWSPQQWDAYGRSMRGK